MSTKNNNQSSVYTELNITKAYYIPEIHLTGKSFKPDQVITPSVECRFDKDEALDWIKYQSANFKKAAKSDPDGYGFKLCLIKVIQKFTSEN